MALTVNFVDEANANSLQELLATKNIRTTKIGKFIQFKVSNAFEDQVAQILSFLDEANQFARIYPIETLQEIRDKISTTPQSLFHRIEIDEATLPSPQDFADVEFSRHRMIPARSNPNDPTEEPHFNFGSRNLTDPGLRQALERIHRDLLDSGPPEILGTGIESADGFRRRFGFRQSQISANTDSHFTIPTAIWNESVAELAPRRNTSRVLSDQQYSIVESVDNEDEVCPICQESLAQKLKENLDGEAEEGDDEIIRLNCGGNHMGCRKCLQRAYEFQQKCPLCKRKIKNTVDITSNSQYPFIANTSLALKFGFELNKFLQMRAKAFCKAHNKELFEYEIKEFDSNRSPIVIIRNDLQPVSVPNPDDGRTPHTQFKHIWCIE
jgi:hypothetical protein